MNTGGWRTRTWLLALSVWLALGSSAGCGGRSIGTGSDAGDGDDPEGEDPQASCVSACEEAATCARAPYECGFFCGEAQSAANEAGCQRAFTALVGCIRDEEDPCSARGSCVTEVNAFGVCMLDYCGSHRYAPICAG